MYLIVKQTKLFTYWFFFNKSNTFCNCMKCKYIKIKFKISIKHLHILNKLNFTVNNLKYPISSYYYSYLNFADNYKFISKFYLLNNWLFILTSPFKSISKESTFALSEVITSKWSTGINSTSFVYLILSSWILGHFNPLSILH